MDSDKRKVIRRSDDRRCALCETLWVHHDKEKDDHREMMWTKLTDYCRKLDSKVDWKVYALSIVLILGSVGAVLAITQKSFSSVETSLNTIHRRITENEQGRQKSLIEIDSRLDSIAIRLDRMEESHRVKPTDRK